MCSPVKSRDCLKKFVSILHRFKQAKRVENKTDGIKNLHTFHVPRHHNKIRLELIKKVASSERRKYSLLYISAKVLLLILAHTCWLCIEAGFFVDESSYT